MGKKPVGLLETFTPKPLLKLPRREDYESKEMAVRAIRRGWVMGPQNPIHLRGEEHWSIFRPKGGKKFKPKKTRGYSPLGSEAMW